MKCAEIKRNKIFGKIKFQLEDIVKNSSFKAFYLHLLPIYMTERGRMDTLIAVTSSKKR